MPRYESPPESNHLVHDKEVQFLLLISYLGMEQLLIISSKIILIFTLNRLGVRRGPRLGLSMSGSSMNYSQLLLFTLCNVALNLFFRGFLCAGRKTTLTIRDIYDLRAIRPQLRTLRCICLID